MTGTYAVILVYSTSYALRAEKLLIKAGIQTKLIPVPRHLSSNCGVCIRIAQPDREAAQQALEKAGVEIEGVHNI
jgi:ribosomal protein S11